MGWFLPQKKLFVKNIFSNWILFGDASGAEHTVGWKVVPCPTFSMTVIDYGTLPVFSTFSLIQASSPGAFHGCTDIFHWFFTGLISVSLTLCDLNSSDNDLLGGFENMFDLARLTSGIFTDISLK